MREGLVTMPKTQTERPSETVPVAGQTPLSANIRRHLGQNLRTHYADALTAPVSGRLEALIAQLDKPKR